MEKKRWVPVPYYYNSPLSKVKNTEINRLHKPGHIPEYLKIAKENDAKNNKNQELKS